jgi:RND family efflux transporter MFP subunit
MSTAPSFKIVHLKLLLLLSLASCTSGESNPKPATTSTDVLPVVVFAITDSEPVFTTLESQGLVEAARDVVLTSRLSGFIRDVRIREGMRVAAGDTLLTLQDEEWRLRAEETEHAFRIAEQAYRIESRLRQQGAASETFNDDLLRQQTGFTAARIARDRALLDLGHATLVAPFAGDVSSTLNLASGAFLQSGTELGRLSDVSSVRVRLDVLDSDVNRLRIGMDVEIRTPDGVRHMGRLSAISPRVDADRKTGQIVVEVPNTGGRLRPGMSATGYIRLNEYKGRIRAPRAALLERDNRTLVFRLRGSQVEWIYVDPVVVTSEHVVLNEAVFQPGDTLAVDRHFAVSHQQRVDVRLR